jgi:hypothetical protein
VTWVMWNLVLVCLETVLVSMQDRCTVCAKRTICLEIISFWTHPMVLLGGNTQVKARVGPFGDNVSVSA